MPPTTKYVSSKGVNIAYQVFGEGPVDVLLVPGFVSHVEIAWEEPFLARFISMLSSFARVIFYDKRNTGLSDRVPLESFLTLDNRIDDILAVLEAAGSDRAALYSWSEGGPMSLIFASRFPERTAALILSGTTAKFPATDDYPEGIDPDLLERFTEVCEEDWGTGVFFDFFAPSLAENQRTREWWAKYQRYSSTPGSVAASLRMHLGVDARPLLPNITSPTLVLHHEHDLVVPSSSGKYLADHIPGAKFVELSGMDHMYWCGDQDRILGEVRSFLEGIPAGAYLKRQRSRRPTFGWEALTESEAAIADLAGAGLGNPEIAARLHLSRKTVESHLSHTYSKLGLQSRAQLAAELSRRSTTVSE